MKPVPTNSHHAGRRRFGRAQQEARHDPYPTSHETTVCPDCGAVFEGGRWRWGAQPVNAVSRTCPACLRIEQHQPAGIVTLSGPAVAAHGAEMVRLARHQEDAERKEHPMNRIMAVDETPERVVINTTDVHLARRIGEATRHAYHGELKIAYEEDGNFARVDWHRD
jgi:NMD protein affecting ribosome stability and mRNA decay